MAKEMREVFKKYEIQDKFCSYAGNVWQVGSHK